MKTLLLQRIEGMIKEGWIKEVEFLQETKKLSFVLDFSLIKDN